EEAPQLVTLDRRFRGRIALLSVAVRTDHRSKLAAFVRSFHVTWPVVWDRSGTMIDSYQIPVQPITYVIDGQGRVVYEILGQVTRRLPPGRRRHRCARRPVPRPPARAGVGRRRPGRRYGPRDAGAGGHAAALELEAAGARAAPRAAGRGSGRRRLRRRLDA